ncbi:MAG TPA: ECF transporter S component [Thermoanaerobacterales bacterium]|uniref:ECF transporter S component n=1 Tax=Tepidanaerobacter sp. GT38 TaxID=2722793 RepID=UPI0017F2B502|nr:ECF transporter S component [Tepidanaerobacter sp. GT38]MCG1013070.1 ECF transporter S component [Tepidanaerobacter sp. GT38]HHY41525.1 ECF transporter S component [Thermoanaerobacterales bacterium]
MKYEVKMTARLTMLSALAVLLMFLIRFPLIPAAPFLEYDPGDIPALIAAFLFGPGAGVVVTLIVSLIQAMTVSAGSGWIGALMHFAATGCMVTVAGIIYKRVHTFKGAIIAMIAGSIAMTLVMIPLNLIFTTKFMNVPIETVKAMLIPVIIPFNLLKASINSVLTVFVYKPVGKFLRVDVPSLSRDGQKI